MKITGIKLYRFTRKFEPRYLGEDRSVGPLHIYDEYSKGNRKAGMRSSGDMKDGLLSSVFIVITTDEGIEGIHGPIEYRSQLMLAVEGLSCHLVGRDPLENRMIWDIMSRFDRHSRSGVMLMAISSVDNALWDLKGKILGQPVYKLLGGGRNRLRPYVSTLGFSTTDLSKVRERASMIRDMGVQAQKWFFRYGPNDGTEGMNKNLDLAFTLRETLGKDYELMFDCWMGWDIPYAKTIFRELEQVKPMWVEEVLRPHMQDAYELLKRETSIPLSGGEHLYTRMEVNSYLKNGIFDVMQSDPVWCGGITEALKIADMCELYGIRFIPHGHALMPAMHLVASMPPDVSPYVEYLLNIIDRKTGFFQHNRLGEDGYLTINDTPGLGEDLDYEKIIKKEEITQFIL